MFRAVVFASLASAGLALPLATPSADAHPPIPHCASYRVIYRGCDRDPWRLYATYQDEYAARRAEYRLRHQGYRVRVYIG